MQNDFKWAILALQYKSECPICLQFAHFSLTGSFGMYLKWFSLLMERKKAQKVQMVLNLGISEFYIHWYSKVLDSEEAGFHQNARAKTKLNVLDLQNFY